MFNYHLMRSESPACLDLTAHLLKRRLDRPTANVVHYLVGTAHLHLDNFKESIHHLEAALSLYGEETCRSVAFVAGYHLRSFTLIWLGLGYLYAAQSLASLLLAQDRNDEARELLEPVYATFVDAFDTVELKRARIVLDRLSQPGRRAGRPIGRGAAKRVR